MYLPGYLLPGYSQQEKNLLRLKKGKNNIGGGGVCLLINLEVGKIQKISEPSVHSAFSRFPGKP